jgi:hypothetical protein
MMFHGLSNHGKYYSIIELSLIWKHNPLALSEDQPLIRANIFCRVQWGMLFSYIKTKILQELLWCKVRVFIKDSIG